MTQPLLSIGMIVKNEERCLEKCLQALEPLRQSIPCELIIADTGSTDKTTQIIQKYADKFIKLEWVNDFSKARNAVLEQSVGKWHLYLDADEYLSAGASQLIDFLTGPTEKSKSFASVIIRNHSVPKMNGAYADFNSLRLFKVSPDRRFIGAIHEYVPYTDPEDCYILTDVVFDHDGYTQITPKHLIEKEKRNLEILEQTLSDDPNNLRTIIQCLEASSHNDKKRHYYTEYALNFLKNTTANDTNWKILAPLCAFRVITYLVQDENPLADEFFQWSAKSFGYSYYITVDAYFIYTKYLFEKQDFNTAIDYGEKYFENTNKYEASKNVVSQASFINPVIFCNQYSKNEIKTMLGHSLLKNNKKNDALSFLEDIHLNLCDENTLKLWLKTIIESDDADIQSKCKAAIYEVLEKHETDNSFGLSYSSVRKCFFSHFSCKKGTVSSFFKSLDLDTSLSYNLVNAQTKEEAEKLLAEFKNWEEFMPQALKRSLFLKAELPTEFFLVKKHVDLLLDDLYIAYPELIEVLLEKYCTKDFCSDFPRSFFVFKILSAILFNETALSKETKKLIINAFVEVSEQFLSHYYNEDLLNNEDFIISLPYNHSSAWYLIKANKFKNENPLEYVKILRTALQKIPQAKSIVEFLIEELQAEEEKKKQEQIKNAAPELLQMAEQLKAMLAAFPADSPELLAIKQSPVYKQVAFLMED